MPAMFRTIIFAAVISGLIGGVVLTGIQAVKVLPLISQAETYEQKAEADGHEAWAPEDGLERASFTLLANVLVGVGFALILCAVFAVRGGPDWRGGLIWGLVGYTVFSLAPAFGLPPELPGMRAAEVGVRQIWWLTTVAATAGGLALAFLGKKWALALPGIVLIVLPHTIAAPHVQWDGLGDVPAELAAAFVSATLVANLLFWLVIGGVSALTFERLSATQG